MSKQRKRGRNKGRTVQEEPIFGARNYKLMGAGAFLIFTGFAIMAIERQIDGFLSLFVSPILILAGFTAFGFGIMVRKEESENPSEDQKI